MKDIELEDHTRKAAEIIAALLANHRPRNHNRQGCKGIEMPRIERTNEKYNRALVKELIRADLMPPEASHDNVDDMLAYLNDEPKQKKPRQPED